MGFSQALVADFRHLSARASTDLRPLVAADAPRANFAVDLKGRGTHLIVLSTHPSEAVLPADKFEAYLREEGLEAIVARRQASGRSSEPGRERFRRHIKTLVQVGPAGSGAYARRARQRLEIVPLVDPAATPRQRPLTFQLLFDDRPLAGALVKFWHRQSAPALVGTQRSDRDGKVKLAATEPGVWMVSVVHMVAATDSPAHDWDSFWGNLTFSRPSVPQPGDPSSRAPRR